MAKRFCVFDVDGVLADLSEGYRTAYSAAFGGLGVPFNPERTERYKGMPLFEVFAENAGGCTCRFRDFATMFFATYDGCVARTAATYPDVRGCVEALSAEGCALGAVTEGYGPHARAVLGKLGISDLFASVVGYERAGADRPDPRSLELCTGELGAPASEVAFVTASAAGAEMGEAAGARTFVLDRAGGSVPESAPGRRIRGLDELPGIEDRSDAPAAFRGNGAIGRIGQTYNTVLGNPEP